VVEEGCGWVSTPNGGDPPYTHDPQMVDSWISTPNRPPRSHESPDSGPAHSRVMVVLCSIMGRTAICVIVLQSVRATIRPTPYTAPAGPLWVYACYACTGTVMGLNPHNSPSGHYAWVPPTRRRFVGTTHATSSGSQTDQMRVPPSDVVTLGSFQPPVSHTLAHLGPFCYLHNAEACAHSFRTAYGGSARPC